MCMPKVKVPEMPEIKATPNLAQKTAGYSFVAAGKEGKNNPFIFSSGSGVNSSISLSKPSLLGISGTVGGRT